MTKLLTPEETANFLNISVKLLNEWRYNQKVNIPYVKLGRLIRYRLVDLEELLAQNLIQQVI